ncbi:MAG TPA: PIN domain-containing protein [Solirubrobacteraceae bacterium]|nr:PIN domain-containing protein [Solirubrobacteraceae bacterium]
MTTPDSSVLIPAVGIHHEAHERATEALGDAPSLIAHVAFETSSVLSRMPEGQRVAATAVLDVLDHDFPMPWLALDREQQRSCLRRAVAAGVYGGALYDALIAATAAEHDVTLLSADRSASATYEVMGARVEYLQR